MVCFEIKPVLQPQYYFFFVGDQVLSVNSGATFPDRFPAQFESGSRSQIDFL